jgi:protein-tyrosine phosphatase
LLDHNQLRSLPEESSDERPFFLPSLTKLGVSWNLLESFPTPVLRFAPRLQNLYVNENAKILSVPSPQTFEAIRCAASGRPTDASMQLSIAIDNRPRLMPAIGDIAGYGSVNIKFEVNKIYPDRVNHLPFVFLGSVRTAQCSEVYDDLDVNYVLTCGRKLDPVILDGMHWKELPLDDLPSEDISAFLEEAMQFIDEALHSRKGVLIHCFAGLSRSVAVTMAYLMKNQGLTRDQALARIRETRPAAHPNAGFMNTLAKYEQELRARGIIR